MATYEMRLAPDPSSPTGFSLQYVYVPSTPVERAQAQIGEIARGLGRQLGLTGRYIAEGTAGTIGTVTNPLAAMGAAATGDMRNFVPLQEQVSRGLTALGVPEPRGAVEESVAGLSRAVAGAGGVAGAARAAIPLATGAVGRGTITELAAMPGRQLAAGATGEGARQLAEAGGAGPIGQTVASVAGGAIPFAGAPTTAASLVDDLSAAYRPGSVVRSGAGPVPPPRLQRAEAQGFDTGQPLYRVAVNDINPEAGPNRAAFFSPDPEYANQFPRGRGEEYPEGARGFSVYASRNVADFTNPDHVARVQTALAGNEAGLEHFHRRLAGAADTATGQPEWMISADPAIRDAVERAGFDGMRLDDFGSPSVAMFRDDAVRATTDDFALPAAPEPLGPVRPRRPSPFDYRAVEAANPQPRPFEIAEPLPAPATYDEAVQQVADLRAQLADADRNVRLSTSIQNPARAGLRSLDQRAVLERQLAAAEGHLARLRPAAPERQNAPGTSEAARAYLERLGMGRVADLGSTRPGEPQAMRRGQRPAGDINAQTQALLNAMEQQAEGLQPAPGITAYHSTYSEPFTAFDMSRLGSNTLPNVQGITGVEEWAMNLARAGVWSHERPLPAYMGPNVMPLRLSGKTVDFRSLDDLEKAIRKAGGPDQWRKRMRGAVARVQDEEFGGVSYVSTDPANINVLGQPTFQTGQRMAPDDPRRRTRPRAPEPLGPVKAKQTQRELPIDEARVLTAAQERFRDQVSWRDSLLDMDEFLIDAGIQDRQGFPANIEGLTDQEAETLSSAARKDGWNYVAPATALPERYTQSIARDTFGIIRPEDLEVSFTDLFDPFLPREDQGFFPAWELRNTNEIKKRLQDRTVETDTPTSLDEVFNHRLHTVRAAAFQQALDDANIEYVMPKNPQAGSEYFIIRPHDPESDADSIKVRFADHARQSGLHERADYNLNTETTDAADVRNALRAILNDPIYNPNAKKKPAG